MRDAPRSPSAQEIAIFSQLPVSGRQSGPTYAKRLCEFALARQTDAQSHAAIHDQQLQCSRQKAVGRLAFAVSSPMRSEEHTSELQSLMRISTAVFCLKKKTK